MCAVNEHDWALIELRPQGGGSLPGARCVCGRCGAPALVAFSGKRQWVELLNTGRPRAQWVKTVPLGPQSLRAQVRAQALQGLFLQCLSGRCLCRLALAASMK